MRGRPMPARRHRAYRIRTPRERAAVVTCLAQTTSAAMILVIACAWILRAVCSLPFFWFATYMWSSLGFVAVSVVAGTAWYAWGALGDRAALRRYDKTHAS